MELEEKDEILICRCGDVSHQLVVRYWEEYGDKEVYVSVHLNKLSFWKRLKEGIKYIFGKQSKYGAFEEIILNENDADKLQSVVDYLNDIKKNNNECKL